jgi:A/G-specific adenine glycosylase
MRVAVGKRRKKKATSEVSRRRGNLSLPSPQAAEVGEPTGLREARPVDRLRELGGGSSASVAQAIAPSLTLPRKRGRGQAERGASAFADPEALLAWYDRHARVLPWRARKGERPDPYRVWLSEIMLQQTTVKAVAPYYAKFLARWPTVTALAAVSLDDVLRAWAGLGYYTRARNLHACARAVVERHGGSFPDDPEVLRTLPGIGSYTAAAVAAIGFDKPAVPVDGNVERVVTRLFAIEEQLPAAKSEIKRLAASLLPSDRAGDFAQALMDLGATICSPKRPACALCPWDASCVARARSDQETFPRKAPKREGRLRRGAAYVALRADKRVLLRTRPNKGLLASMTEVPGSEWSHDFEERRARRSAPRLKGAAWRRVPGRVQHVFTHFPLELAVFVATVPRAAPAPEGARWVRLADLAGEALPNLMRKVINHALEIETHERGMP